MSEMRLGRLTSIEPRSVWEREATDFTPWLALPDNLALLGEAVGIDLELEAQEQNVGPFRADLLCRDMATEHWVLIENQIERTDHTHLGQLMTYAAGLDAAVIVWVARQFSEEHRAALDWLNHITDEKFRFFGVEIELWRIADSPIAPHFKVVSKPNEWSKSVKREADSGELSETRQVYYEYWMAFRDYLIQQQSPIRINTPPTGMWTVHSVGKTGYHLSIRIGSQKREAEVLFIFREPLKTEKYNWFLQRKDEIERQLGTVLEWRELPDRKESHIRRVFPNTDPANRDEWPNQHEMVRQCIEAFDRVFRPLVKQIDENELERIESTKDTA